MFFVFLSEGQMFLFALFALCSASTWYLGGGDSGSVASARAVMSSGATHVRVYLLWRYVQQTVKPPLENISVSELRSNFTKVAEWAAMQNWGELDRRIGLYANSSIEIIGEVTEGTTSGLPSFNGTFFDPNVVGKDLYLAYVYRAARATVSRYKNRVKFWQIENELNEAWVARWADGWLVGCLVRSFSFAVWGVSADFNWLTVLGVIGTFSHYS